MAPTSTGTVILGGGLFLAGAVSILMGMGRASAWLIGLGLGLIVMATFALVYGSVRMANRSDPLEARKQQRLWRSGPLGRRWLERRRRRPGP